jgi:hypothetical protein
MTASLPRSIRALAARLGRPVRFALTALTGLGATQVPAHAVPPVVQTIGLPDSHTGLQPNLTESRPAEIAAIEVHDFAAPAMTASAPSRGLVVEMAFAGPAATWSVSGLSEPEPALDVAVADTLRAFPGWLEARTTREAALISHTSRPIHRAASRHPRPGNRAARRLPQARKTPARKVVWLSGRANVI